MAKKKKGACALESIFELTPQNVWGTDATQIIQLWDKEKNTEDFPGMEEKLLNTLRLAFDVVHYNPEDPREQTAYGQEDTWMQLESMAQPKRRIALRAKTIARLSDLTKQNIHHISAAMLLELMDRNFGGGWDAIPNNLKEVIESAFDISTTQLPTSRIHIPGGSVERKLKAGYELLEIQKGTWTEAVFARKKEILEDICDADDKGFSGDDDLIIDDEDNDSLYDEPDGGDASDDTYYSQYAEEANPEEEMEDGMHIDNGEELE